MKKIFLLFIVSFLLCGYTQAAAPHDVLAHSAGEWTWFAHVSKVAGVIPTDTPGSNQRTELFALQNAPGQQWQSLGAVPGRAVALAGRSSQLAMLMVDGQWLTIWSDGSASGQPLPGEGRMKTLTDDGTHLWAIGAVSGGIAFADQALARESAVTQPSTAPVLSATPTTSEAVHLLRSVPSRMVVFRELNGRWATVAELPADAVMSPDDEEMSLAVVGGVPLVSFKTSSGAVRTIRYAPEHVWQDVKSIPSAQNQLIENFRILSDGFKPLLWWTTGNSPGEFLSDTSSGSSPVALAWGGKEQLDGIATATFAGGYLCVFGPHAGKVMEQRYKLDGTPVDTAAELNVATDVTQTLLPRWFEVVLLASMGFSVGASVFRQWTEPTKGPAVTPPVPALLLPRLGAGVVDALPILGAIFFILIKTDVLSNDKAMPVMQALIILGIAAVIYVLHTTITEVLTARSAGKWIFGLKVVTLEGLPPARSQLLIRNLLRVIDPLIMIMISPEHQRSADAVAGTMVVPLEPLPPVDNDYTDQD